MNFSYNYAIEIWKMIAWIIGLFELKKIKHIFMPVIESYASKLGFILCICLGIYFL
jgi:hypothetical protein